MRTGVVYTESVVHLAPERFADDVPYQIAIISLEDNTRITARIEGARAQIGDAVAEAEPHNGIPYFRKK